MVHQGRNMPGQGVCLSVGSKIILSTKKRKTMAANEFEKNVRKEMDEFKIHPSEDVWVKVEERIRENKRKRRILFFILFSSIALILGGYGLYNLPGKKIKSETQDKFSKSSRPNDENKNSNSNTDEHIKETIAIKPKIPVDNSKQTNKTLTAAPQKRASKPVKEDRLITSTSKRNPISKDQTRTNVATAEEKKED